jgi:esterase/lipase
MQAIASRLPQPPRMVTLTRSDHVITCDVERQQVFQETLAFFSAHSALAKGVAA